MNVQENEVSRNVRLPKQFYDRPLTDEEAQFATDHIGIVYWYGTNNVGDPQLYRVVQAHTSQSDWPPDQTPALYTPIGLTETGYAKWSQPTGASDAYNTGDIVSYNGTLYRSLIDGNVWSPEAYPAGWEVYVEG